MDAALGILIPTLLYVASALLAVRRLLKQDTVLLLNGNAGEGKKRLRRIFAGRKMDFRKNPSLIISNRNIVKLTMKRYTVILYGSYARGDFRADSDIDFMFLVDLSDEEIQRKGHDFILAVLFAHETKRTE